MLLAFDIGNTTTHFALYDGAERIAHFRVLSERDRTGDEWDIIVTMLLARRKIEWEQIRCAAICSVVPQIERSVSEMLQQRMGERPLLINAGLTLGMEIRYDQAALGADRFANAVGAYLRYLHRDTVVVDLGTATKLEAVLSGGVYLGGVILPGIGISCDALYARAAKLSQVELTAPPSVIGTNTADALRAGILHGYAAQVEGLVARFRAQMKRPDAHVTLTGGYAEMIASFSPLFTDVQPFWTLDSIRLIHKRYRGH